ncbi:MAG: acyltransferase [Acidobacteriaceae bacterium]|nr:acyltransferase [Acidobacteriaceae bacterium]
MAKLSDNFSPANPNGSKDNLLFVDNVRFCSMVGIVAVHTLFRWYVPEGTSGFELQALLLQATKFGTVGFYLISGFLLGGRLEQRSPCEYLLRRIKSVAVPWAVWASLAVGVAVAESIVHRNFPMHFGPAIASVGISTYRLIFFSPFWFVPNFLLSLSFLLMFRRYLDDLRLAAVLLACTLFYSVNIYGHWIASEHTTAIFGFTFYQWLGVWGARNSKLVFTFVERIQMRLLVGIIFLTGSLALAETHLLLHFTGDPYNSLRLSNQLFSVAVVIALMRLRRPTWPHFVDVRSSTFGLYLLHYICLGPVGLAMRFVQQHLMRESLAESLAHPALALALWLAMFFEVYILCSVAINIFLKSRKLSWIIGQRRVDAPTTVSVGASSLPEDSAERQHRSNDLVLNPS